MEVEGLDLLLVDDALLLDGEVPPGEGEGGNDHDGPDDHQSEREFLLVQLSTADT